MSFVIVGGERYALEYGETVVGGIGPQSLDAPATAQLPAAAFVINYPVEGPSTARSLNTLPVSLNGDPLGDAPRVLHHGDRLAIGELGIAFGHLRQAGRTSHVATVTDASSATPPLQLSQASPTACTGGHLTRLSDRASFPVPEGGLTLGRDPDSHVVLTSDGVSRVHAVIAASLLGYTLTDRSVNGVLVNGARVDGTHVLGQGDVLRLGLEEFRFEADEASFEPDVAVVPDSSLSGGSAAPTAPRVRPALLLATLEVLSPGPMHGERYRLDRPTIQLGRGPHNDIRLDNDSVSGTHASLVQRKGRWVVLDLSSRNGTRVDGELVREQCELPAVCELQLGALQLLFRAINAREPAASSTISVIAVDEN
jgi:pSer/pThr/pTyr-binding forkhead associated (FHA) protein